MELLEEHSYKEVAEVTGISKSTLLRARGNRSRQYRVKNCIYIFGEPQYRRNPVKIVVRTQAMMNTNPIIMGECNIKCVSYR